MAVQKPEFQAWVQQLIDWQIVPRETRRIIIDIPCEGAAKVYYECYADKRMFTIDLAKALIAADVVSVADVPEKA